MRRLELTDDEALVLWFIGRNLTIAAEAAARPRGREIVESLQGKLAGLLFEDDEFIATPDAGGEQTGAGGGDGTS